MTGTSKKSHGFSHPSGLDMIDDALRYVMQRDVAIDDLAIINPNIWVRIMDIENDMLTAIVISNGATRIPCGSTIYISRRRIIKVL